MELVLGVVGTVTGILALITSVVMHIIQARKQEQKDRLAFLSSVIFDTTIPRESRQPFYDEYITKHGNGPVVRFWLLEGEKEKLLNKG